MVYSRQVNCNEIMRAFSFHQLLAARLQNSEALSLTGVSAGMTLFGLVKDCSNEVGEAVIRHSFPCYSRMAATHSVARVSFY